MASISKTLARVAAVTLLAFGLGAVGPGCGKPKVRCDKLCKRMSTCYYEVMQKQGQLSNSTIRLVKKSASLRKRFKTNTHKFCKISCKKHNKKGKWSRKKVKRIKKCIGNKSCSKFASCVTKHLR